MRRQGRYPKYDKKITDSALKEYIESSKTMKEVAEEYSITTGILSYQYRKWKEIQSNG